METAVYQKSYGDYRLSIYPDNHASNPFDDMDGLGKFYSLHRHSGTVGQAQDALENNPDCIPLSVYSHSGEHWSVIGELPAMMRCEFDSVNVAGAWLPDDVLLSEVKGLTGDARRAKLLEYARQAMEVLNQYLAGDIYGYIIEKKEHCARCGHDEYEHIDSCWGFYGLDECVAEGESNIPSAAIAA